MPAALLTDNILACVVFLPRDARNVKLSYDVRPSVCNVGDLCHILI